MLRYKQAVEYYKVTNSIFDPNSYPKRKRKRKDHNVKIWSFAYFPYIVQSSFNFDNLKLCL